jgi:hypothetical protein
MKIELRKISHNARLSEETSAYTAQVWVDGVHICDVSNHGQGGGDSQYPAKGKTQADVDAINAEIKATYPKNTYEAGGETHSYDADLETVCGDLLADYLLTRDLKRLLGANILFEKDGKILQVSTKKVTQAQRLTLITLVKQRNGVDKTINEMPFDDALAIFKKVL